MKIKVGRQNFTSVLFPSCIKGVDCGGTMLTVEVTSIQIHGKPCQSINRNRHILSIK